MSPSRRVAVVGLVAMSLCACGGVKGVSMESTDTRLAFGVHTPTPNPAALAAQLPGAQSPLPPFAYPQQPDLSLPSFEGFPFVPGFNLTPCPAAPLGASPATAAGTDVVGTPAEGLYRWKQKGTLTISVLGITVSPSIGGYRGQVIRRVTPIASTPQSDPLAPLSGNSDRIFTYQTVTEFPGLNNAYYLDTWRVKTNPAAIDQAAPEGGVTVNTQEPEGGLTLIERDLLSTDGKTTQQVFTPTADNPPVQPPGTQPQSTQGAGLLFMPLPVSAGQSWTSTAVDATHGYTWKLSGQVLARDIVDACGTLVEGWKVHADMVVSSVASAAGANTQVTESEDYMVAPQLGCILISDSVDRQVNANTHLKATFTLGQTQPDPTPADLR